MRDRILHTFLTDKAREGLPINFWLHLVLFILIWVASPSSSSAEVITSQAAVVMDASTGEILYGKNSNHLLPPASTAKLMTAIVVMEKANLSDIVTISQKASHAHPVKAGFRKGDKVTMEGLLYAALVKSANRRGTVELTARQDEAVPDGVVFIPFAYVEAAANLLTNPALDPFGKIPEFKFCAAKVEKVEPATKLAAE